MQEGPGPGPGCSAPCSGSAGCSRRIPCRERTAQEVAAQPGQWLPLLADLLGQWAGDRHGQAVGLFDTLQLPLEELHWGYLWLDLCALARHGEQSPQVTILHKWDLSHLLEAEPRHRLMAFCQDLLRLCWGRGRCVPCCIAARLPLDEDEGGAQGEESKAPASASWLNWFAGAGALERRAQASGAAGMAAPRRGARARVQDPETEHQGGWDRRAPGRSGPALSTQYANLLDEADWALVRTLQRIWASCRERPHALADHPACSMPRGRSCNWPSAPPLAADSRGRARRTAPGWAADARRAEPGRRGPWRAHRAPGPGSVAAHSDAAGAARQAAGPGGHPCAAARRARRAPAHPGCHPDLPWHSQVAGLKGNAELPPGPASPRSSWIGGRASWWSSW